ncbi:MAG: ABC transporter permease [PVC group bacterium]|nr:ABC transporter permease [PVC group bacterium]
MGYAYLKKIYDYRELIKTLAAKEVKIKYKSAVLGWLWSILNPLLLMIVFSLVFTFILPVHKEHFPIFLLCALLPWFFLSISLNSSTTSIVENSSLIKKAYFPHEVIPISVVAANLVNFLISLVLLFAFLFYFRVYPTVYALFLPLIVLFQCVFVTGVCLGACALHTMFRDVRYAVELLLVVWFYATPVFYAISDVPARFRTIFYCNPLSLFVMLYRDILLYQRSPDLLLFGGAIVASLICFIIGAFIFFKYKKYFVDVA